MCSVVRRIFSCTCSCRLLLLFPCMCVCTQDFPIMPVEAVGFMLKPYGFFNWNPTLDLPPDTNKASKQYQDPPARKALTRQTPRPRL